ncbi:MAG: response regulator, partial [Alphaproteobacteria bacterium]|nr:response regulator [Alphaproteobacteria bacterium]
ATPAGTGLAGLRVLCVDNEPAILEALTALLGRWGMTPVTAPDAAAALALAGPFDAALVDLHLGDGSDGLSLVADLRARGLGHIALITADADETVPARAAAAGAALMSKPVKPAALKAFLSARRRG